MNPAVFCLTSTLLSSCVFVPEVVSHYDESCQIESRQMVLSAEPLALIPVNGCSDEVCLSLLAGQVLPIRIGIAETGGHAIEPAETSSTFMVPH